uniref:Uncharacterized protein n=1 Tax=Thermococcus sp. IRI33 TaxID=1197733 RepID=L0BAE4_9EURY|nr:hypothetical protein [Thermococcus sp. IRI33]AFZ84246.1 hypothetical protein i33-6 [Thermococcus sp. IRI33]
MWKKTSKYLPPHQVVISEEIFRLTGSYKVCWICGDEEDLYLLDIRTENGIVMEIILCGDCHRIQEGMGLKVIDAKKII